MPNKQLNKIRDAIHPKYSSCKTEKILAHRVKNHITLHHKCKTAEMVAWEIEAFLFHLAQLENPTVYSVVPSGLTQGTALPNPLVQHLALWIGLKPCWEHYWQKSAPAEYSRPESWPPDWERLPNW